MKLINKLYIYLLLLLLFMSANLLQTINYSKYTNMLIFIPGILLLLHAVFINNFRILFHFNFNNIMYIIFLVFCFISSYINRNIDSLNSSFKLLFFFILLNVVIINVEKVITFKGILKTFIFSILIVLLLNFNDTYFPIGTSSYKGIYSNPNNFGGLMAPTLLVLLIFSYYYFSKKNVKYFYVITNLLFSFFILYLMVVSSSRTAFIAIIISILLPLILINLSIIIKGGIRLNVIKKILIGITIFFVTLVVLYFSPISDAIYDNIILKFINSQGNITASRDLIWSWAIENSRLLGTYDSFLYESIGFTAHNTFLSHISHYGWIAGIFYILYWLGGLIKVINHYIFSRNKSNFIVPLMIIVLFVSMSMMEVQSHTSIMYLAMISNSIVDCRINNSSEDLQSLLER